MTIERLLDLTQNPPAPADLYTRIAFPAAPSDRPYVYINMASTVDGKIVVDGPGRSATGVGGATDQTLFRRLQRNADAALIGGSTLRASQVIYPPEIARFVATRSGDLPSSNRFFTDAPSRAYVVMPEEPATVLSSSLHAAAVVIPAGRDDVDWPAVLRRMRTELGVQYLLCEGGGELNDQLFQAGLADELFLTLAPKVKGGRHLPTMAGGDGFAPGLALPLELLSAYRDGSEVYLRYRLGAAPRKYGRVSAGT